MHKMASEIIDIRKNMNGLSTKMKEITDILKKTIQYEASINEHDHITPTQAPNRKKGIGISLIERRDTSHVGK
jgi:hypothetical protein